MLAPLLVGAGVGFAIVAILKDWNDGAERANFHFTQINNTYVQITNGHGRRDIKILHDECFQHWVDLKSQLYSLEAKKRDLYSYAKAPGLSYSERTKLHEILQDMKKQSLEMRNMKATAHDRWQRTRATLVNSPVRVSRRRLPY